MIDVIKLNGAILREMLGFEPGTLCVCLDAGHGGSKPGAVANGLSEDDLTLEMVQRIGHYLRLCGIRTIYTRVDDRDVAIDTRAAIACQSKCSMFVSVHINSSPSESAHGIEALCVSVDRRGWQAATRVLEYLNGIDIIRGVKPDSAGQHSRLGVLRGTYRKMPAMLLELLFISNRKNSEELKNRFDKDMMAQKVASGIVDALIELYEK